ncbi:hypothetical protein ACO11K_001555 [Bacillus cytotoxicus]
MNMNLLNHTDMFKKMEKEGTEFTIVPDQLQVAELENQFIFKEYKGEYIALYKMENEIHFTSGTFGQGPVTNKREFFRTFGTNWIARSYKAVVCNSLLHYKRMLKDLFSDLEDCYKAKYNLRMGHKWLMECGEVKSASEKLLHLNDVNQLIKRIENQVLSIGLILINAIRFWNLSINEICTILGANELQAQKFYKEYQVDKKNQTTFKTFFEYAVHRGLEYRHCKGRMKDIYDCPKCEMPFYWAVNEVILDALKNSEEYRKRIHDYFKNELGLTMYRTVEDLEGNVVDIVKDGES